MEVSSHALHQRRIDGVELDVAVLTNIARDHLDYHGSVEAYAAAKRALFAHPGLRHAVLNRDDPRGKAWADAWGSAVTLTVYGIGGPRPATGDYLLAESVETHRSGLRFDVLAPEGRVTLDSRLLARFNVYNLLAALGILRAGGVSLADATAALCAAPTVPGRAEAFRGPKANPLVVVDYAHTPQALEQIIEAIRPHVRGRLSCVFGCGGDRDRGKRPMMGLAAVVGADAVIVTDDNPRFEVPEAIVADILKGIPERLRANVRVIHDRAAAIEAAIADAAADDVVVVAGKGHEDYQIYGPERRSFSDRAWIAARVGEQVSA
jgi:UDP-N-acetylmuramoyl-L-alanyl-D-glutamate--2,6-diaminopimelate ligase